MFSPSLAMCSLTSMKGILPLRYSSMALFSRARTGCQLLMFLARRRLWWMMPALALLLLGGATGMIEEGGAVVSESGFG